MSDNKAFTTTPDQALGNAIAVVQVTNAAVQIVDQQIVTLGDPTDGTLHAGITASGLAVQTGPVVVSGTVVVTGVAAVTGTVTANQGTSPWVVSGAVTVSGPVTVANAVTIAGTANVALSTGSAVIGALTANQSVTLAATGTVVLATAAATIGQVAQATSPWVIGGPVTIVNAIALATGAATIGQIALVTGAAVIGALTANQSVTIAATANVLNVTGAATLGGVFLVTGGATTVIGVEPKDTGRTAICLTVVSAAGITTEALATMTILKGLTTITAATTYTVTTGKTLRVQSVAVGGRLITATNESFCRVNVHTATVVTVASPTAIAVETGTAETGTLVANSAFFPVCVAIPDGLEVAGTNQVGISHVETATTVEATITLVGYEY